MNVPCELIFAILLRGISTRNIEGINLFPELPLTLCIAGML